MYERERHAVKTMLKSGLFTTTWVGHLTLYSDFRDTYRASKNINEIHYFTARRIPKEVLNFFPIGPSHFEGNKILRLKWPSGSYASQEKRPLTPVSNKAVTQERGKFEMRVMESVLEQKMYTNVRFRPDYARIMRSGHYAPSNGRLCVIMRYNSGLGGAPGS